MQYEFEPFVSGLIRATDPRHEAVVSSEIQKLLVVVQLAAALIQQHRLHAIRQDAFAHAVEITEGVHQAVQQVMDILPLGELDITHARVAQCQSEAVQPASTPVAEVSPVHLTLLPRFGFEADKGTLALLFPPRRHH